MCWLWGQPWHHCASIRTWRTKIWFCILDPLFFSLWTRVNFAGSFPSPNLFLMIDKEALNRKFLKRSHLVNAEFLSFLTYLLYLFIFGLGNFLFLDLLYLDKLCSVFPLSKWQSPFRECSTPSMLLLCWRHIWRI